MFGKGKKRVGETKACNHDAGTADCESISKIRELNREKLELDAIDLRVIIKDYFRLQPYTEHYSHDIFNAIVGMYEKNKDINFEALFQEMGRNIDKFFKAHERSEEINRLIKEEKKKLGIE